MVKGPTTGFPASEQSDARPLPADPAAVQSFQRFSKQGEHLSGTNRKPLRSGNRIDRFAKQNGGFVIKPSDQPLEAVFSPLQLELIGKDRSLKKT